MQIGSTTILNTFAEAFGMRFTRLIITAADPYWLDAAIRHAAGYACSVIACDAEAGVETWLSPEHTPDGRPGASVLVFGFSCSSLATAVSGRVGQCVMTCPTSACYNGLRESAETIPLGKHLRYFGDGFQKSKQIGETRFWRIPVMDGEFLVEETAGVDRGVAGGNLILQGATAPHALDAAKRAAEALRDVPGVITPFPAGVVRSGSKVGSRYQKLKASTADAFCPTLRGRVQSELIDGANCAYEIVIDGASEQHVANAMQVAIKAAAVEGVLAIGAGNYGGQLGKYHFQLHELLS